MTAASGKDAKRWPRAGRLPSPSKCQAGAFAGFVTGLLAGIGVAIALGKEIDSEALRWAVVAVMVVLAALGGMFTGAIAAGCYSDDDRRG